MQFIDLGLPSGKLWATENATLDGKTHFTFDEAVKAFGEKMPESTDFQELYENGDWRWDKQRKGYTVTGPNGNSIFLPASGYRDGSGLFGVDNYGCYWSRNAFGAARARFLVFWSGRVSPQHDDSRYCGFAVRLVKNADATQKNTENQKPKLSVIPEAKLRRYLQAMKDKPITSKVLCDCGKLVNITPVPYAYNEENNDVWFAAICPHCGELILTKE